MSIAQQLFVVFFAIFWGTSSNAWPRWKPFQWPLFFAHRHVRRRIAISMLLLNVCPIIYFAAILAVIQGSGSDSSTWQLSAWLREVIRGVVPAFAVFGLYRIWLGVVELGSSAFYLSNATLPTHLVGIEPTVESLRIDRRWCGGNFLFGALYVAVSLLTACFLPRP